MRPGTSMIATRWLASSLLSHAAFRDESPVSPVGFSDRYYLRLDLLRNDDFGSNGERTHNIPVTHLPRFETLRTVSRPAYFFLCKVSRTSPTNEQTPQRSFTKDNLRFNTR